jgi:hypothetical protein
MRYQLYAFDAEPVLVEEFEEELELEELAARCEELVHEDGYARAEVWDESGELVYAAGADAIRARARRRRARRVDGPAAGARPRVARRRGGAGPERRVAHRCARRAGDDDRRR